MGRMECEQRRRCGFSPCISSWFILKYFSSSFPVSEKHRRSSRVLLGLLIYVDLSAMKTVSTGKVSGGNEEVHRAPDLGRWSEQASGKDPTVIWPHAHTCSCSLGLPSMLLLPLLTQKQVWELTGGKGLYTAQHSPLWLGEGLDSSLEMHRCCLALVMLRYLLLTTLRYRTLKLFWGPLLWYLCLSVIKIRKIFLSTVTFMYAENKLSVLKTFTHICRCLCPILSSPI